MFIIVPPINEHIEIVEFLRNTIDEISKGIAVKLEQIAILKEFKSTLINSAVTGKIKVA